MDNSLGMGINTNWTPQTPLSGETPSLLAGVRSGNKLLATVGNDIDILLPIYKNGVQYGSAYDDPSNLFEIGNQDFTMVGWVRSETTTVPVADWYKLMGKSAFNVIGGYGWGVYDNDKFTFFFKTTTGGAHMITTNIIALDQQWHLLVVRINVTTKIVQLYIDNVKYANDIAYTGVWNNCNLQFKVACEPNGSAGRAPFDFSDIYVYRSYLNDAQTTNLYNHVEVNGALAHWSGVSPFGDMIMDFSGNNLHLQGQYFNSSTAPLTVGYDKNGSRQGLDHGYVLYSNGTIGRYCIPNKDDGTESDNPTVSTYATYLKVRSFVGNMNYHNLSDSYLDMNNINFDRSNVTRWSALARNSTQYAVDYYDSSNPDKWYIKEIQRFNLYYWANTGYEGICLCKGYPNSFSLNQYLGTILSYNTNKSSTDLKKVYKWSGDYSAELIIDGDFSDPLSYNIWFHPWHYITFTGGKANYTGIYTTPAQTGCLRLYLQNNLIVGRKYKLTYDISNMQYTYAYISFTGNAAYIWDLYNPGFQYKIVGHHEEILTCINGTDNMFEIQVGIGTQYVDGQFSIDNVSLKIIE